MQKRFDEEDMPLVVLWLDIEYSEDHKYFIWDKKTFPDPVEMINDVAATGRKVRRFFRKSDVMGWDAHRVFFLKKNRWL